MPVFLSCGLCGVKAVDGILSRYAWGLVKRNPHRELQVCPVCKEKHSGDWERRLLEAAAAEPETPRSTDPYGRNWASAPR